MKTDRAAAARIGICLVNKPVGRFLPLQRRVSFLTVSLNRLSYEQDCWEVFALAKAGEFPH